MSYTEEEIEGFANNPDYTANTEFLPTVSIDTTISSGLISDDTFTIVWYPFDGDISISDSEETVSPPDRVTTATFDTGEMTIYKEVVAEYVDQLLIPEGELLPRLVPVATGEYWNKLRSVGHSAGPSTYEDDDESTTYTTVFSISLDTNEANALEDKYSQTDYSIEDIDDNIASAFTSTISSILSSAYRIPTKQTWRKQKQKPLKEKNRTSMDEPGSEG